MSSTEADRPKIARWSNQISFFKNNFVAILLLVLLFTNPVELFSYKIEFQGLLSIENSAVFLLLAGIMGGLPRTSDAISTLYLLYGVSLAIYLFKIKSINRWLLSRTK